MEEKEQNGQQNNDRRRTRSRHRRRNGNNNNTGGASHNKERNERQGSEQKGLANGGYTRQNQKSGRDTDGNGNNRSRRSNNRSNNRGRDRRYSREQEVKKPTGYQPDNSKDAIRTFDLGTCDDAGTLKVFHFDKGTYTIADRKVLETVTNEDGTEEVRYEDTEILSTRDKVAAYKAWNELKRPKKGKGGREREEKKEQTDAKEGH